MNEYWLLVTATLGVAMTLAALFGLFLVAGLRWALVDGRWKRTRPDLLVLVGGLGTWVNRGAALAGSLGTWVNRGASLVRLLVRGERPPGGRGV